MIKPVSAIDIDDVIMRPTSNDLFKDLIGLTDEQGHVLQTLFRQYKHGQIPCKALHAKRFEFYGVFDEQERWEIISQVVERIPQDSKEFINSLKELCQVYLVSNSDVNLVGAIAKQLGVGFVAENQFIFKIAFVTNQKQEMLARRGIKPDIVLTDDPLNEAGFLDLAKLSLVYERTDFQVEHDEEVMVKYVWVSTLEQALEKIRIFLESI